MHVTPACRFAWRRPYLFPQSGGGGGGGGGTTIQRLDVSLDQAALNALGDGASATIDLGSILPANAQVLQRQVTTDERFTADAISSAAATLGSVESDVDTLLQGADLRVLGAYGEWGTNPYPSRGGEQLTMTITLSGGATFALLTGGGVTATVIYAVVAP